MTRPVLRVEVTLATAQRADGNWQGLAILSNGMKFKSPPFKNRHAATQECERMLDMVRRELPRQMRALGFDVEITRAGNA